MAVASVLTAVILGTLPSLATVHAFAPSSSSSSTRASRFVVTSDNDFMSLRSSSTDGSTDNEDFDPFMQSPHSFGDDDDAASKPATASTGSTFGFLSNIGEATAKAVADDAPFVDMDFDPLLSPHAYANGVDADPVDTSVPQQQTNLSAFSKTGISSTFGFDVGAAPLEIIDSTAAEREGRQQQQRKQQQQQNNDDDTPVVVGGGSDDTTVEFDPLLSPHAYANGVDAAPVIDAAAATAAATRRKKLGILLIDHGSRRQASNEHIHNIASMYEDRLNNNDRDEIISVKTTVVRAAHMEISAPSIIDSLRKIISVEKVDRVVCVPYFLSPGRHATEDIPELIGEAKELLKEDGFGEVELFMSNALGTHLDSMLGAVDKVVEMTLSEEERYLM